MKEKICQLGEFYWLVFASLISQRLASLTRWKKGNIMLLVVCLLSAVWPQTATTQATLYQLINDQIVEDKCLVLLVIDVIKPQRTYFNNRLQLSCRSSKFSSSFSATSVLFNLYASLDPTREPAKCFKFFSDKHLFIYYFWPHTMNYKQNKNDNK